MSKNFFTLSLIRFARIKFETFFGFTHLRIYTLRLQTHTCGRWSVSEDFIVISSDFKVDIIKVESLNHFSDAFISLKHALSLHLYSLYEFFARSSSRAKRGDCGDGMAFSSPPFRLAYGFYKFSFINFPQALNHKLNVYHSTMAFYFTTIA